MKNKIALSIFVFFVTLLQQNVHAEECQLPICDIPKTIALIEGYSVEQRSVFLNQLFQKYANAADPSILLNLHDFSFESYQVSKKLNDPANVLAWSVFLRESSIHGLLRFGSFELSQMKALYLESSQVPEISKDRSSRLRFDAFQRWKIEIPLIFDLVVIKQLFEFISYGIELSKQLKDDDFIEREGQSALSILSQRLSYLYPMYEGIYQVSVKCNPSINSCEAEDLQADRLVIMNTVSDLGIFATLATLAPRIVNFIFSRVNLFENGTLLKAKTDPFATTVRPAEMKIVIDEKSKTTTAGVVNSHYVGSLAISGKLIFSPLQFYSDKLSDVAPPEITGIYKGKMENQDATLIVRQREDSSLYGTLYFGTGQKLKIDFTVGQFIEFRQLIVLVSLGAQKIVPQKLILAYRKNLNNQNVWTGKFYSVTGYLTDVSFNKTGPVEDLQ